VYCLNGEKIDKAVKKR